MTGAGIVGLAGCALPKRTQPRTIAAENEKPGTTDWMLTHTRVDPETQYRCPWIEGYCSRTSVRSGDSLAVMVGTNPPSPFTIDVYRLGYYGGKGGRLVSRLGPFSGRVQPDPPVGEERLRECQWEPAVRIKVPDDWLSGVYLGKLKATKSGHQSYVIFIVRDDGPVTFCFSVGIRHGQVTIAGPVAGRSTIGRHASS